MQIQNFPSGTPTMNDLLLFQSSANQAYYKSQFSQLSIASKWTSINTSYAASNYNKLVINTSASITITLPIVSVGEIEIFNINSSTVYINTQGKAYSNGIHDATHLRIKTTNTHVRLVYLNDSIGWYPIVGGLSVITDATVSALLNFNGSNGSTTFVDAKGGTVTAFGAAQISTAQSKFGGASGYFNGSGSYLTLPLTTGLTYGTNDITWECWIYLLSNPASASNMTIMGNALGGGSGNAGLFLCVNNGRVHFRHWVNGTTNAISSQTISANTWYHVAATKRGTALQVYVNGIQGTAGSTTASNTDSNFFIGRTLNNSGFATDFNGYIDDLQLSAPGVFRYTGNFTPPISQFTV
ncbi:LamG domain-containing protein [Nostoc favosum]|uniref:LamG domain-containing protein n=1 Tax=Nostoc favosum CHAB5714 TaxID=2780399 RepID=A0ABS8I145_9NOSO|nr:LamG domain-containing protein [Nostoc favosum]MCC5597968.1 LamG domain-containing protein [Nostoc favosum CHAB5714]